MLNSCVVSNPMLWNHRPEEVLKQVHYCSRKLLNGMTANWECQVGQLAQQAKTGSNEAQFVFIYTGQKSYI